MTPKLSKIVLGYWNENSDSCFRFNNSKQFSNWIIFVSFCSFHLSIKNIYNVHIMKKFKNRFSAKNPKFFVYYNENMYTNSKFQTQFSRKLQRFRIYPKNKKCSIFHELSEYQQKLGNFFFPPTGPLKYDIYFQPNGEETSTKSFDSS